MSAIPSQEDLKGALKAAAQAHHEFQETVLKGVRHEQWAWWYSAYILGRLDDFTTPTLLTKWLGEVSNEKEWFKKAAEHVFSKISNGQGSV